MNSLGDSAGIVLVHAEIHNCLISAGRFGESVNGLSIHLEVPSVGLLLIISGAYVLEITPAETTPTKKWNLNIKQKEGKPEIEKCEGGEAETLVTSTDGGESVPSAEEAKEASLEFEKEAQTAMT
jgi:hypothetical protein